jgi:hypothetical protein
MSLPGSLPVSLPIALDLGPSLTVYVGMPVPRAYASVCIRAYTCVCAGACVPMPH